MFKIKKLLLNFNTFSYIILFLIEIILYLKTNSNIYGVYYLLSNLIILFLIVPVTYNYKRYYSKARISKIILIILLGIFTSFIIENIIINNMKYMDASNIFIDKINILKNILKPIIYFLLLIFLILETKAYLILKKIHLPKLKKS